MSIITSKKINCDKYIDMMAELDISQVESSEHHIMDSSRVYVDYPCGREINYGDLHVRIAHTSITDNFILEEFIIKAYIKCYRRMHPIPKVKYSEYYYRTFLIPEKASPKKLFDASLIPIKKEKMAEQLKQWFNEKELKELNIDISKIVESAYIGEVDFYGDNNYFGYAGHIVFTTSKKIYYVDFLSNI